MKKVVCGKCGYMIALKTEQETSVRVDDVYIYFWGGASILICRGCASANLIVDEEYEHMNSGLIEKLLLRVNHVRASFDVWKSRKEREAERNGKPAFASLQKES